jgi:hypothetical protein
MGIAVPSLAEASRRLPSSVKADPARADDVLVTSVAIAPPAIDEPVSPELALVDPELRERLRALLPEIELEPPAPLLRALPDPELDDALPLAPPPELGEAPALATAVFSAPPQVPVYVYPTRGERFRSFAKAFVLGAAAATVITVGVIAERDEGPVAVPDGGPAPPSVAAPVPAPTPKIASGGGGTQKTAKKPASAPSRARAKQANAKQGKTQAASRAKTQGASAKRTAKAKTAVQAGRSKATPPPAASAEPKRFAWAPVDGAVGYRFELFRGAKQVLEARTKAPVFELASRWRHAGRTETLTKGDYRWYVWPLLPSGPAAVAVVQARLTVP